MIPCRDFDAAWAGLDPAEPLPADLAEHLAGCPRCRALSGSDPTRLFAVLRGASPEAAPEWEAFRAQAALRAGIRARARRQRRAWVAASAAAIALVGGLWLTRGAWVGSGRGQREVEVAAIHALSGGAGGGALGEAVPAAAPPTLESIASPGARVVNFKIFGQQEKVTEVILIFDEGIDL